MIYDYKFFDWKPYDSNKRYISKEFNTISLKRRANLPVTPGCYIWKYNNCILYIGRTNNMRNRLGDHIFGKIYRLPILLNKPKYYCIFRT